MKQIFSLKIKNGKNTLQVIFAVVDTDKFNSRKSPELNITNLTHLNLCGSLCSLRLKSLHFFRFEKPGS